MLVSITTHCIINIGTRPIANAWKKWELGILEPTNLLKKIGKDNSDEHSPRKRTPFELDTLINELEQREKFERSLEESDDDDDDDDIASKKPADSELVRISFSDFEDKLVSSKEELQITTSKEKIIRTQAQATQAQLTDKVREEAKLKTQPQTGPRTQATTKVSSKTPLQTAKLQHAPGSQGSKQQQQQQQHLGGITTQQTAKPQQPPAKQQQRGHQPKQATQQRLASSKIQQPPMQQQSEKRAAQQKSAPSKIQEHQVVPRTETPPKRVVTGPAGKGRTVLGRSTPIKTAAPNTLDGKKRVTAPAKGTTLSLPDTCTCSSKCRKTDAAGVGTSENPIHSAKNVETIQQKQDEVQRSSEKASTACKCDEKSGEEKKSAIVWKDKAVAIMQQRKESDGDNVSV